MKMLLISDNNQPETFCKSEDTDFNFVDLLKSIWDDLHDNSDVFRYKVNNLEEKFIGQYLLQLNPERGSNRRMPEHIENICQPFDPNKFNFTKVSAKEIIFNFKENHDSDTHTVFVNVSPISRYHSLLCPSVRKCLPQIVTRDSLELCLRIMFLAKDRNLRIGFNSLCGFASVNHLHYHLVLINHDLPVEKAKCKHLTGSIYSLEDYPVPAFCFQVQSHTVKETSKDIFKLLGYFIENSIAHNIFITRGRKVQSSREIDGEIYDNLKTKANVVQSSKEVDEKVKNVLVAKGSTEQPCTQVNGKTNNSVQLSKKVDGKFENVVVAKGSTVQPSTQVNGKTNNRVQSSRQVGEEQGKIFIGGECEVQSNREVNEEVIRVLIWPRKSSAGIKPLRAFNVALCELSGWFPIYTKQDYENLTTEDLEKELQKWKIDNFDEMCENIRIHFVTNVS